MANKRKTEPCGDWHKSWGLGTNKVGNLKHVSTNGSLSEFVWSGHSQGRHGQVWNKGAKVTITFNASDETLTFTDVKGSPINDKEEIIKSIQELLNQ